MGKMSDIACAAVAVLLVTVGFVHATPRPDGTMALARHNHGGANKTRLLAERGDARAQTLLGLLHEHGRGVPQDYVAAAHWYSFAAAQGDPTAQYLLGLMYDKGHGVPRSHVLAYKWLNLAAARARPGVRENYLRIRDALAAKLTPAQVDHAQWLAYHFIPMRQR